MPISDYLRSLRARIGHELVLMPAVAAIVRDSNNHILVLRRSDNNEWNLPAGAVDPGETPAVAVVREVQEETGLVVRPTRVLGVFGGERMRYLYPNGDLTEYLVVVFACETIGGVLESQDGEALELRYVPASELPSLGVGYPDALFGDVDETLF